MCRFTFSASVRYQQLCMRNSDTIRIMLHQSALTAQILLIDQARFTGRINSIVSIVVQKNVSFPLIDIRIERNIASACYFGEKKGNFALRTSKYDKIHRTVQNGVIGGQWVKYGLHRVRTITTLSGELFTFEVSYTQGTSN